VKSVVKAVKHVLRNPVVRTALAIAAAWYAGSLAWNAYVMSSTTPSLMVAGAIQGATAGFVGGTIMSGSLSMGFKAALAGAVAGGIMGYLDYGANYPASRIAANGFTNGVSSKIQGGDFMDGLRSGLMTSMLTFANVKMRAAMIKSSLGNPMNDGTGLSAGMFGDYFHLAGERLNQALVDVGKILGGPLGGVQNGQGRLFGVPYSKGGFVDMVLESFAGPHDYANSPHFYAPDGTGIAIEGLKGKVLDFTTNMTTSLAFATPFAAAAIAEQTNYSAYGYIRK